RLEPAARGPCVRARQRPRRKSRPAPGRDPSAARRAGGRRLDAREHRRAGVPDRTLGRGTATARPRRHLPRAVGPATDVGGSQAALAVRLSRRGAPPPFRSLVAPAKPALEAEHRAPIAPTDAGRLETSISW